MIKEFNIYIDGIPLEFWKDLCREEREVKRLKKGESFLDIGEVCKIYLSRIRKKLKEEGDENL